MQVCGQYGGTRAVGALREKQGVRCVFRSMVLLLLAASATCVAQKAAPLNRLPARLQFGQAARSAEEQRAREDAVFHEYAVTPLREADVKPVRVQIDTRLKRMYRTRLREAAGGKPVFAGSVAVSEFGCGTGCSSLAMVDLRTGASAMLHGISEAWSNKRIEMRSGSRALHVVGDVDATVPGDRWYVWTGSGLELMAFQPLPADCFELDKDGKLAALWTSAACNFMPKQEEQ